MCVFVLASCVHQLHNVYIHMYINFKVYMCTLTSNWTYVHLHLFFKLQVYTYICSLNSSIQPNCTIFSYKSSPYNIIIKTSNILLRHDYPCSSKKVIWWWWITADMKRSCSSFFFLDFFLEISRDFSFLFFNILFFFFYNKRLRN